jgi:hypothetical protein
MRGSRRALAAVAVAIGLLGASCGGGEFNPRARRTGIAAAATTTSALDATLPATLRRSAAQTAAAGTARTAISVTVTGLSGATFASGALDVAGTGVVDLATGNAKLALSVPRFDRVSGGRAIEQRIVRGVAYLAMPTEILRIGGLPASVRWLRLDPESVGGGADPGALSQAQVDPAGQLAFVAAISNDVRRIGAEPVRGEPATHYAATVVLPARPTVRAADAEQTLASIEAVIGTGRVAVDVWLDGSGRARRVVVSVPLANATGTLPAGAVGAHAMMRVQADLYAFGTPVQVAAPPPAQVRPYSTLRVPVAKA